MCSMPPLFEASSRSIGMDSIIQCFPLQQIINLPLGAGGSGKDSFMHLVASLIALVNKLEHPGAGE